jgi:archaetidylinositol phosphate synthase
MKKEEFNEKWSALHGGAEVSGIVKAWLGISFQSARICTKLRISPNFLTLLGVIFAVVMVANPLSRWSIALLVLSLFADGIDGSVAMYQGRESSWGALLDSVADRVTEALWLFVGYHIGVPAWVAIALWLVASTQEYMRARIASLGVSNVGVITPAERPMRASFLFIALIAFHLEIEIVAVISYLFFAVTIFSFYLVSRSSYKSLSS